MSPYIFAGGMMPPIMDAV